MSFENFLERGRQIVAEHRAQYTGVYYMKGGFLGEALEVGTDIVLGATGNAEFIPLANAAESTAGGLAKGESFGKALGQGAISGGEALAGQELAGAVGIGQGNTLFNDALGITGDNPAGTGLPDLGKDISGAFGGGSSGASSNSAIGSSGTDAIGSSGQGVTATPSATTSVMPAAGGGTVLPSSLGSFDTSSIDNNLANNLTTPSTGVGSGVTSDIAKGLTNPSNVASNAIGSGVTDAIGSSSSGGLSDFIPSKSAVGSTLLREALPLAATGFEAAKGPAKLPSQATALEAGGAATAPLLGLETAGANEASSGQLTPTQQANIEQGVQQQQNQLIQQLASQGITNPTKSTQYRQGLQQIQQWALSQQQAYITQAIGEATTAGGAASSNIAKVADEQIQLDKDYQDALAAAFGALGGGASAFTSKPTQAA